MSATKAAAARPDISILGVVTKDLQHLPGAPDRAAPGGVPIYAGLALCALGLRVEVRTRLASRDAALLAGLRAAGADIEIRPARATTQFENLYSGGDLGTRRQRVQAQAGPFAIADLRGLRARAVHLGPLLPDDLPLAVLRALRSRATLISLDVQGYARRLVDGAVRSADWPDKRAGLACIDILKADAEEAEALTGQRDPGRAARALAALGPREVLVTLGAAGSLLLAQGRCIASRPIGHVPSSIRPAAATAIVPVIYSGACRAPRPMRRPALAPRWLPRRSSRPVRSPAARTRLRRS